MNWEKLGYRCVILSVPLYLESVLSFIDYLPLNIYSFIIFLYPIICILFISNIFEHRLNLPSDMGKINVHRRLGG
jgi:hypothetical protein